MYRIEYSPLIERHMRSLTARQRSVVFAAVERQLRSEPAVETRNRKPLRPNPIAPWELRIGGLRVYYEVHEVPDRIVQVLAVGLQIRDRVRIGREVMKL